MQPPRSAICVICGIRPATTQDHVPPKGLFKGISAQLITVPACADCNNGSSAHDEDMRFFISLQVGKRAKGSAMLWDQGALKSVRRKKSLRSQVLSTLNEVETTDSSGNKIKRLTVEVPAEVYESVFSRTTRGLYFHHTGQILPANTAIIVSPWHSKPSTEVLDVLHQNSIGGEACRYWYGVDSENHESSLWVYEFYRAHWVQVSTGQLCEDDA